MAGIVDGEQAVEGIAKVLGVVAAEAGRELGHTKSLGHLLEKDFDKDTAGTGSLVLVEVDGRQHVPANGIAGEKVAKEAGNVAQLVGLVAMDGVVVLGKGLLEHGGPATIQLGKALTDETKELGVCLLLRTALDDHGWQFCLTVLGKVDGKQLVNGFVGVHGTLDG